MRCKPSSLEALIAPGVNSRGQGTEGFQQLVVEKAVRTVKSGYKTFGGLAGAGRRGVGGKPFAPLPSSACLRGPPSGTMPPSPTSAIIRRTSSGESSQWTGTWTPRASLPSSTRRCRRTYGRPSACGRCATTSAALRTDGSRCQGAPSTSWTASSMCASPSPAPPLSSRPCAPLSASSGRMTPRESSMVTIRTRQSSVSRFVIILKHNLTQ